MERKVVIGKIYKHFKGNHYKVLLLAKDSETLDDVVIYQDINVQSLIWTRPYKEFLSLVDKSKYPDIKQIYRFEEDNYDR